MAFEIKRNDLRPRWRVALMSNDLPVDLTAAESAAFTMKQGSSIKVNKEAMVFLDRVNGIVEYEWAAGDTDTSGTYNAEVEVDWGAGAIQSFPSKGYFTVTIEDDLA
jgi:hypothetical protein